MLDSDFPRFSSDFNFFAKKCKPLVKMCTVDVVIVYDVDDVVVIVITVVVHHRSKLGHQRIVVKRQGRHL